MIEKAPASPAALEETAPAPEGRLEVSLDSLVKEYQTSIDKDIRRVGIGEMVARRLKTVAFAGGVLTLVLGPSVLDGISRDLTFPEAVLYATESTILGSSTLEHMEPEDAKLAASAIARMEAPDDLDELVNHEVQHFGTEFRHILFDAGLFAVVLTQLEKLFRRRKEKVDEVREGKAEIHRNGEQLFVIGGQSSNIADALTMQAPTGVIPIFEDVGGGRYLTSKMHSDTHEYPLFLDLGIKERDGITYRKASAWEKIKPNRGNLVRSQAGAEYLVVIGCGERAEEELDTNPVPADVTQEELHSAADMLQMRFKECGTDIPDENVITVYLGSGKTPRIDDETGKETTTDREVAENSGISIYVDTWTMMLTELEREFGHKELAERGVRLISSVIPYRELVKEMAQDLKIPHLTKEEDAGNAILLVYERLSDETLNRVRRLKEEYPDRKIIALTSNVETDDDARQEGIATVCSATVIRDIVQVIRSELKKGATPAEIQKLLDGK